MFIIRDIIRFRVFIGTHGSDGVIIGIHHGMHIARYISALMIITTIIIIIQGGIIIMVADITETMEVAGHIIMKEATEMIYEISAHHVVRHIMVINHI